ncbi:hypothetical protein KAW48_07710, partial [candidate division WOR-3 bacterium]|nr:hypothetical protein [candidate division WOR-3 bacterium]
SPPPRDCFTGVGQEEEFAMTFDFGVGAFNENAPTRHAQKNAEQALLLLNCIRDISVPKCVSGLFAHSIEPGRALPQCGSDFPVAIFAVFETALTM